MNDSKDMNDKPNPTENFLVSAFSTFLSTGLRPALFVMRSHMGVRHTALIPVLVSAFGYGTLFSLLSLTSAINAKVILLYVVLIVAGYVRNTLQARRRRRMRDWSVNTWSSGESLLVPVLVMICRRLHRAWGSDVFAGRRVGMLLTDNFIYYVAEPLALLVVALALWSIGSVLFFYPVLVAISCAIVRNDAQLFVYLKASEIPDGKMLEREIKSEFEGPKREGNTPVAEIAPPRFVPLPTDSASVFERLSPELQTLLMKDRYAHGEPLR